MASIVIIFPSISKSLISSGIAVISLDLSSTFNCPTDIPISLRKAETI